MGVRLSSSPFLFYFIWPEILLVYSTPWVISGCDITRLEVLINAFYQTTTGQGVDGSFFAFAWSVVLQEPSVYVGVLPPGNHSEVYVAPPPRVGKKGPGKPGESVDADRVASLEPVEGSKSRTLEQLRGLYEERLRIAVDIGVLRVTLAGPHARVCPG